MRGKKGGVEAYARKENPCLLDISGDTVHMVSNSAKALLNPFGTEVQDFCSDIYYDIEKSPKQKEIFSEYQSLLHKPQKSLVRPISSRFLQMLDVCNRVDEVMDALVVYYYHFIPPDEEHNYRSSPNIPKFPQKTSIRETNGALTSRRDGGFGQRAAQ
ncbi:hypothetical protein R3I94_013039 [Phoxinus phoxinus]